LTYREPCLHRRAVEARRPLQQQKCDHGRMLGHRPRCPRMIVVSTRDAQILAARLAPHVEALLVKAERGTANVNLAIKLFRRNRWFADVAERAGALAGEVCRWRFGWQR